MNTLRVIKQALKAGVLYLSAMVALCMLNSCKTAVQIQSEYAYVQMQPECISYNSDGSLVLRSWGMGSDKNSAIENAKRNALETVVFKGINGSCFVSPLISEPNVRERNPDYFNDLLGNPSNYSRYIETSKADSNQIHAKAESMQNWSIVATVDIKGLRRQLVMDKIIPD